MNFKILICLVCYPCSWAQSRGDNNSEILVVKNGSEGEHGPEEVQSDCADVLAGEEDICRRCPNMVDNATLHLLMKASEMQNQIKNKTGLLSKIHHRATHSEEALWASISLSALLFLLFVSVFQSKMWQDKTLISYADGHPVRYEQNSRNSEITTRQMLRSRARSLTSFFLNKRRNQVETLNMESFLHAGDTVDSAHQVFLESSSASSEDWEDSDDSEEEVVYSINKYTGEWENGGDQSQCLIKKTYSGRAVRRRGYSSGSEDIPLISSVSRELLRASSSSEEDDLRSIIRIG